MKKRDLLRSHIQKIVEDAYNSKIKKSDINFVKVDYACIFAQTDLEYSGLYQITKQFGEIIKYNSTEVVFHIEPLETVAGNLEILKIARHDSKCFENGDAYFLIDNDK